MEEIGEVVGDKTTVEADDLDKLTSVADLGLEKGGFSVEWARLRAREFLKTTPTFGQNLAYSALNSFSLVSLAS